MKVGVFSGDAAELADALVGLVPQLSRSNPPPTLAHVETMLGFDAITQFVARSDDGLIIGVSTLVMFPIPTGWRAWVEDVIVDESARGQGVGEGLTQAMIDAARERGCTTIELTSRPTREAANRLYQRMGFTPRDTNVYRMTLES
jgi:ribosomal protein S18 acetylase RimI-like enzyme